MGKKHDERSVLAQLKTQWKAEIDYARKAIKIPTSQLSIHICGKIDYLRKYCGWMVYCSSRKSS